ncbi:hypothetical protein RchiOBHm_Chr6g0281621 [Rosa chinensis]|uniref:Uncharacterized protein n=1 Tax=Rosa chinensis TaxID=74649 RepID=A0A2P6PTK2_ROSCH|nr:hypothetical protein RchiOBHm_Chr6g0281621 [Rosa chinensis]
MNEIRVFHPHLWIMHATYIYKRDFSLKYCWSPTLVLVNKSLSLSLQKPDLRPPPRPLATPCISNDLPDISFSLFHAICTLLHTWI